MGVFDQILRPLKNRISNMIARGVIQLLTDTNNTQLLQVRCADGETHDGVERFQQYGLSSSPPLGSETLVFFIGGYRDHPIALDCRGDATRKEALENSQAEAGDVVLYTAGGQFIRLGANGKVYIDAPENIHLNARGVLRLEGQQGIEIYSPLQIKWDCGGRGYTYTPALTNTWEVGSVIGSVNNITPPEHPPAASEEPLY